MPPKSIKRGAIPSARYEIAAAMPHLPLSVVPPTCIYLPNKISLWHNDYHGDCVTAEEAFAKACHNPEIFISDDEVKTWASNHGWYEGAEIIKVVRAMQKRGFEQDSHLYNDGTVFSVDWTDSRVLQSAIYHGPVKLGVAGGQLDALWHANGGNSGWVAVGFRTDRKHDHCVCLSGYGPIGWLAQKLNIQVPGGVDSNLQAYAMFTWGSIGIIDPSSLEAITNEAWLRNPTTLIAS